MSNQYLSLTYEDNIAIIEIDIPPANTLSSGCIQEMRTVMAQLNEEPETHGVIITGAGKFFAAGADIKEFVPALGDQEKGLALAAAGQSLCNEIEIMDKPVIAAMNGPALGGGLELALACHYRMAADSAILGLPELNLGLIPGFGGTQRLSRLTDVGTAMDIILTGRQLSGNEAKQLGIVHRCVPKDQLMKTATETANSFTQGKSMTSVTRAMQAITQGYEESLDHGLKRERELFAELFTTNDAKEGIHAFVDKRKPNFKHT